MRLKELLWVFIKLLDKIGIFQFPNSIRVEKPFFTYDIKFKIHKRKVDTFLNIKINSTKPRKIKTNYTLGLKYLEFIDKSLISCVYIYIYVYIYI